MLPNSSSIEPNPENIEMSCHFKHMLSPKLRISGQLGQDIQDAEQLHGSARRALQDPRWQQPEGEAACRILQAAYCW